MSEFTKFRRSLANHPGLTFVTILLFSGAAAGLNNPNAAGHEIKAALIGASVMCVFWIPVLITAWKSRHQYGGDA